MSLVTERRPLPVSVIENGVWGDRVPEICLRRDISRCVEPEGDFFDAYENVFGRTYIPSRDNRTAKTPLRNRASR
jgi:hypothetical protein